MSGTAPPHRSDRRSGGPSYRPVAVLGLVYVAVLFLLFAVLLILPELATILESTPPGPEQEALAHEVAQRAVKPRLPIAFLLAVGTTALGAYFRVLPGLRP